MERRQSDRKWGGKREGAGRPRLAISDAEVKELIKAARRRRKETGISIADTLMEIIYAKGREIKAATKIAAIKLYYDQTVTAASESQSTVTSKSEPAIYLPEMRPDPAELRLVKDGR